MRIACLQFDPQVGEIDDNLDRADAVLSKVHPDHLDELDLLVLPELAFTGYNFRSLQHIAPFLEEAGSGIAALWARTTALKHDCAVVVGYPEKVDVSPKWPASPEYHNSALIVNGDGDAVGNYRKSFLYYTDETWALEGGHGFFQREIPGLGNVALGICTDLNPYKLEAPWDAFEFGFHVLKAQANLVILSMAWQSLQDADDFHQNPAEPDLETLVYWVQRLEPLVRADNGEEVIVVFCNRTGTEGEATYTGTSAVIGIKQGEVFVYGVLGRGVNELLIVDTDHPPMSKLTDADAVEGDGYPAEQPALSVEIPRQTPDAQGSISSEEDRAPRCHPPVLEPRPDLESPRQPTSPRLPWLAQSGPGETPTDSRSPTRLQIPMRPQFNDYIGMDSAITDDVIIDTPAADTPGFHRQPLRPKLAIPSSPWRFPSKASPYPWHHHDGSQSAVFGGGATMTPITPFDEDGWSATPIDPKAPPPWYWRHEPTLSALKESVVEEEEKDEEEEDPSESPEKQPPPSTTGGGQELVSCENTTTLVPENTKEASEEMEPVQDIVQESTPLDNDWAELSGVLEGLKELKRPGSAFDLRSSRDDRPSSPKSRNLSRSSSPFRLFQSSELDYEDWGSTTSDTPDSEMRRASLPGAPWEVRHGHGDLGHAPARPASRTSHRLVHRSLSYDGTGARAQSERLGRRQPSRLRHAIYIADEDSARNSEADDDSEPEHHTPHIAAHGTESGTRGRQPPSRDPSPESRQPSPLEHSPASQQTETRSYPTTNTARNTTTQQPHRPDPSVADQQRKEQEQEEEDYSPATPDAEGDAEQHHSPLTMDAIRSTMAMATATTPSLCSVTSAASAASVATLDDDSNSPVAVYGAGVAGPAGTDKGEPAFLGFESGDVRPEHARHHHYHHHRHDGHQQQREQEQGQEQDGYVGGWGQGKGEGNWVLGGSGSGAGESEPGGGPKTGRWSW